MYNGGPYPPETLPLRDYASLSEAVYGDFFIMRQPPEFCIGGCFHRLRIWHHTSCTAAVYILLSCNQRLKMAKGKPKGSVHAVKSTAQQMLLAKKLTAKQVAKSIQEFRPDDSGDELEIYNDANGVSDDDEEEEVFDLDGEEEDSDDEVNKQGYRLTKELCCDWRNDENMVHFAWVFYSYNSMIFSISSLWLTFIVVVLTELLLKIYWLRLMTNLPWID